MNEVTYINSIDEVSDKEIIAKIETRYRTSFRIPEAEVKEDIIELSRGYKLYGCDDYFYVVKEG